jgi:hypothetical protein
MTTPLASPLEDVRAVTDGWGEGDIPLIDPSAPYCEAALLVVARHAHLNGSHDGSLPLGLEIGVALNSGPWQGLFVMVWRQPDQRGFSDISLNEADQKTVTSLLRRAIERVPRKKGVRRPRHFGLYATLPPLSQHGILKLEAAVLKALAI